MIILDACIIRALNLRDSSADLLRALRAVGERVAIPWMVAEELLAQRVILHQEAHAAADAALKDFARHTPWNPNTQVEHADADRVRKHWQAAYETVVETLTPSPTAMRDALYREANILPPCKSQGKGKMGARDALIWLTAVEYAREHPQETVYFVSGNTRDFGKGSTYAPPMDQDVAGLGDRFVHLTTFDEVIKRFTKPGETDEALATEILGSPTVRQEIGVAAENLLGSQGEVFPCTTLGRVVGQETAVMPGQGWVSARASLRSVDTVRAYRIGEREWYTAIVRWRISGVAYFGEGEFSAGSAGSSWTTSVLFTPDAANPRVTILRHDLPLPLSTEEFTSLGLTHAITSLAPLADVLRRFALGVEQLAPRGLSGAYEGALLKQARQRGLSREGELLKQARQSALERRLKDVLAEEGDGE
ncbi:PIN domain-containing protein [Streptomyces sp. WAC01526]|uniref:PIN domain-containing protein n=1 Tax=Streptomyces sp. WAC01526 TaxID=2588709 RepID=UPI0011DF659A|nr:PIN domain-containing protein [Streptomyces sp. WAC01526]